MNNIFRIFTMQVAALLLTYPLLANTAEVFDVRVQGRGFLGIQLPDGSLAYSKSSLVAPNENGVLATEDGYHFYPTVIVDTAATDRRIDTDGTVSAIVPPSQTWTAEGQLMVHSFEDPSKLKPIGAGLYKATNGAGHVSSGTAGSSGLGQIKVSE